MLILKDVLIHNRVCRLSYRSFLPGEKLYLSIHSRESVKSTNWIYICLERNNYDYCLQLGTYYSFNKFYPKTVREAKLEIIKFLTNS